MTEDLFLCFHSRALPLRVSSSCGRSCCRTERRSSRRSRSDEVSRLRSAHTTQKSDPSESKYKMHLLHANPNPLPQKKCSAQQYSCKLRPTHQNVRACVSEDWNTRQRIAHNHLLHREKAFLLEEATQHAHAHQHTQLNSAIQRLRRVDNSLHNTAKCSGSIECRFCL